MPKRRRGRGGTAFYFLKLILKIFNFDLPSKCILITTQTSCRSRISCYVFFFLSLFFFRLWSLKLGLSRGSSDFSTFCVCVWNESLGQACKLSVDQFMILSNLSTTWRMFRSFNFSTIIHLFDSSAEEKN